MDTKKPKPTKNPKVTKKKLLKRPRKKTIKRQKHEKTTIKKQDPTILNRRKKITRKLPQYKEGGFGLRKKKRTNYKPKKKSKKQKKKDEREKKAEDERIQKLLKDSEKKQQEKLDRVRKTSKDKLERTRKEEEQEREKELRRQDSIEAKEKFPDSRYDRNKYIENKRNKRAKKKGDTSEKKETGKKEAEKKETEKKTEKEEESIKIEDKKNSNTLRNIKDGLDLLIPEDLISGIGEFIAEGGIRMPTKEEKQKDKVKDDIKKQKKQMKEVLNKILNNTPKTEQWKLDSLQNILGSLSFYDDTAIDISNNRVDFIEQLGEIRFVSDFFTKFLLPEDELEEFKDYYKSIVKPLLSPNELKSKKDKKIMNFRKLLTNINPIKISLYKRLYKNKKLIENIENILGEIYKQKDEEGEEEKKIRERIEQTKPVLESLKEIKKDDDFYSTIDEFIYLRDGLSQEYLLFLILLGEQEIKIIPANTNYKEEIKAVKLSYETTIKDLEKKKNEYNYIINFFRKGRILSYILKKLYDKYKSKIDKFSKHTFSDINIRAILNGETDYIDVLTLLNNKFQISSVSNYKSKKTFNNFITEQLISTAYNTNIKSILEYIRDEKKDFNLKLEEMEKLTKEQKKKKEKKKKKKKKKKKRIF